MPCRFCRGQGSSSDARPRARVPQRRDRTLTPARRSLKDGAKPRPVFSVLAFIAGLLAAFALDAFWIEPASLHLVVHRLAIAAPPPYAGLRIAVIADLHAGARFIDPDKVSRAVALTDAAHPDLILLAGDYTGRHRGEARYLLPESIAQLLKPLHARLGVYAVLGNHDHWDNGPRFAAALRAAGITVLTNAAQAIATPQGPLYLAGIDDAITGHDDIARALASVPPGKPALCLSHTPDIFPALPRRCFLTIAAHTHGGQIALPVIGPPVVPSRFGRRYAAGLVRENGHALFVATGIGTSILAARFRVPPEISLLELH